MWPNPLIMHSLVKNSGFNFPYKKYLMLQMKKLDVQASVSLIKIVEKHISIYKDILVEKVRHHIDSLHSGKFFMILLCADINP